MSASPVVSPIAFEHVVDHITEDLAARYAGILPIDTIQAAVHEARAVIEPGNQHPEFKAGLIEHAAKQILADLV